MPSMDPQTIKDSILYGIAACFGVYLIWKHLIEGTVDAWRATQNDKTEAIRINTHSLEKLGAEIAELRKQMSGFELMPGLVKVCEAHVVEVAKHREAVTAFTKLVVREPVKDEDILENYDENQADRAFAKGKYMAEGYPPAEAEARVDADEAVQGMWSGTPGV
jgi:hypothetical protein